MFESVGVGKSDPGTTRIRNEDRFLVDDERGLYVVCDGMGGQPRGDWAADLSLTSVAKEVREHGQVFDAVKQGLEAPERAQQELEAIVGRTNQVVHTQAEQLPEKVRMGTTMTALLVAGEHAVVADVGDSRCYLWRDGQASAITRDDTLAQAMVDEGALPPEDAPGSHFENVLTQAVGIAPSVNVETHTFTLRAGDRFLLCSDGLSPYLDGRADLSTRMQGELAGLPEALIRLAKEAGSEDNITAVAVSVTRSAAD